MRIPVLRGLIDRRILVNFRISPDVLSRVLPPPFRPQVVNGWGIGGICLIRLTRIRPRFWPARLGFSSENAAHRIAVEWDTAGGTRRGVYIPRRDTSSRFNTWVGGRLFPGVHHHARFQVEEQGDAYSVRFDSVDGVTHAAVDGRVTEALCEHSVFGSVRSASEFFEQGSLGYSPAASGGVHDALELRTRNWSVTPLKVDSYSSSYFNDRAVFPSRSVEFDSALLMRHVPHEWIMHEPLSTRDVRSLKR